MSRTELNKEGLRCDQVLSQVARKYLAIQSVEGCTIERLHSRNDARGVGPAHPSVSLRSEVILFLRSADSYRPER